MLVVPGNEAEGHNLPQKRKYYKGVYDHIKKSTEFYEKLSLFAYEGSSLTLLGTVSYDPAQGAFKMTKLAGLVTGGLKECLRFFERKIQNIESLKHVLVFLTGLLGSITFIIMYQKFNGYRLRRRVAHIQEVEEA